MRLIFLLLAGLLLLPLTSTPVLAKVGSSAAKIHVVKAGDSLYEIARHNGMTVKELKRLNGLSSNRLSIGQKLALNRAAAPPLPETTKSANTVTGKKSAPAQTAGQSVHTVKKGDTLQAIARKNGMSVDQLKQLNRLANDKLQIGQQLALATPGEGAQRVAAAPAPTRQSNRSARELHVVRKGDTLSSISRRHHVSVKELKRLNGLRSNNLKIGQRLALNDPYEERNPILLPGDANEEEIFAMAYSAESELEQAAFNFLSTPYRFGGTSRRGIDCSSFVQQVFREVDIDLPRSAREQFRVGTEIDRDDLQPGDLVFFRTYARFPSHVGIYLGDNKMIHASSRSRRVVVTSLDLPYYRKRFIGAKRISLLDDELPKETTETGPEAGDQLVPPAENLQVSGSKSIALLKQELPSTGTGMTADAEEDEDEELGDSIEQEDYLVPLKEQLKPAPKPLKSLTALDANPPRQTASTLPVTAAPVN